MYNETGLEPRPVIGRLALGRASGLTLPYIQAAELQAFLGAQAGRARASLALSHVGPPPSREGRRALLARVAKYETTYAGEGKKVFQLCAVRASGHVGPAPRFGGGGGGRKSARRTANRQGVRGSPTLGHGVGQGRWPEPFIALPSLVFVVAIHIGGAAVLIWYTVG